MISYIERTKQYVRGCQTVDEGLFEDFAAYTCATGLDYDTGIKTDVSRKDRLEFLENFPEYATLTYKQVSSLPKSDLKDITDWFFSSWFTKEHVTEYEDAGYDEDYEWEKYLVKTGRLSF